jgi:hypothetical protein
MSLTADSLSLSRARWSNKGRSSSDRISALARIVRLLTLITLGWVDARKPNIRSSPAQHILTVYSQNESIKKQVTKVLRKSIRHMTKES